MNVKLLLTIAVCYVIFCVFTYHGKDAQARQKSAEELYQRTWLVGMGGRVTRMLDEETDNTCYVAQNSTGSSIGIYCLH